MPGGEPDRAPGGAGPDDQYQRIRATESHLEFAMAGSFTILVGGTLYYVYSLFEPLVPSSRLAIWATMTGAVTLVMAAAPVVFFIRKPSPEAVHLYWSPFGKAVAVLFDIAVASSVWLLLPSASEPLQLLMVIFYSAAISGQVISTAESIWTNIFAVLSIFGSAAIFFLQADTPYAVSLAVFLMAFGGLMIIVALVLKQAIRTAIASRLDAERLSDRLAVALEETQAARDARTRFIAAASHDLRQPLQAAMLFFRQMTRHPDPARREEAAEGVRHGFAEANALLERMMEHLRIESGAIRVHRDATPLAPLFAALAEELRPGAQRASIALMALPTRLWADTDRTLLARILRNLLQNAITHSRGTRLRLWARPGRGGMLRIFVADDGVGLSADFLQSAFDAYSQGSRAARQGSGMGLGLSIARELARLMGGDLTVVEGTRAGATFCLTLPEAQAAAEDPAEEEARAANIAGIPVLVIDDDRTSAVALGDLLCLSGADARVVCDLAALREMTGGEWSPAVIVTDWQLGPEATGADAVAAARTAWPDAAAIVMTGDGDPQTALRIQATGWPVLWKPVDYDALKAAISSAG